MAGLLCGDHFWERVASVQTPLLSARSIRSEKWRPHLTSWRSKGTRIKSEAEETQLTRNGCLILSALSRTF